MRAWLPYESIADAEAAIGKIPENVEVDLFTGGDDGWPDSIAEVEFLVMPYMQGTGPLDRVAEMTSLQVVQTQTAGYEGVIDLLPAGVSLCNAAGVHDTATAELAVALALDNGRKLDVFARNQPEGRWKPQWGNSIADQRVLIIGYGHIGKGIEARLSGFETASITKVASRARDDIRGVDELDQLLPEADVVFVIAPYTPRTDKLLDAEKLALLPDGALVVNVARGKLIDTEALIAETGSGRLRAALDVTEPEPLPADHPLWRAPGVVISPHIGGAASSFEPRIGRLIGEQLRRWAAGEELLNKVN
ncbi:2-hydroxyacid dehydrogenase [Naumannella halotolerans]|uniref:Phosphoglycerate dehydrogenase-like enzyme n=1 Tax=Naumannella halotolerans TaxID=993414 RepID=A0A4R7J7D8_9ACTN|nr:2-hydroxyacid dehydrogenase [Naumannella halotolerans]TDT33135.1 phosphoglycerate dehydrogenase-like enzyme [Naumannella halotolerans]